jgi:ribosome biogenesis GTPase
MQVNHVSTGKMKTLGFERYLSQLQSQPEFPREELARVIVEHKERYLVQNNQAVFKAEIIGNLRYSASSRKDFPAVGDWVRISMMDKDTAIIMEREFDLSDNIKSLIINYINI